MYKKIPDFNCIAAMIPTYTPAGDITTIFATNGHQQQIDRRTERVLNRLARSLSIDLVALKEKSTLATEKSIYQPLPLAPDLVLCPLKVRPPRVPGDTTVGYINFRSILTVVKNNRKPYKSTIKLVGGTEIPVIWTQATVKQHLQQARLVISHTPYDPKLSFGEFIHIYQTIEEFWRLGSFRNSSDQNFVPIP